MKKCSYKILAVILTIAIFGLIASKFDFSLEKTFRTLSNQEVLANTCTPGSPVVYYTNTSAPIRKEASANGERLVTLEKNTQVTVYCTTNGYARVSNSSEKYISVGLLTTTVPDTTYTTTTDALSLSVGEIDTDPDTIYYENDFTNTIDLSNITNLGEDESDRVVVTVKDSSGNIVTSKDTSTCTTKYITNGSWTLADDNCNGAADVGEVITVGTESFYVISNDGTNIKALAEYNLYVGGYYDGSSYTAYGDEATGLQDSSMLGWTNSTVSSSNPRKGVTAFSDSSSTYSGSIVEEYVNNYEEKLNDLGANLISASLITTSEMESLGCSTSSTTCKNAIYSWVNNTSYWTQTANGSNVWKNGSDGVFTYVNISYTDYKSFGVRPVITVASDEVEGSTCTVTNGFWTLADDNCNSTADTGEIITVGTESFYVISNDGSSVKAIAKYNLYVGSSVTGSTVTAYGNSATGLQNATMRGSVKGETTLQGITAFSSSSNSYSSSTVKNYVDAYKTLIDNLGANSTAASLITKDELTTLGCSSSSNTCTTSSYDWLYSTSYWTSSSEGTNNVWFVSTSGTFDNGIYCNYDNFFGVRPVITIPASLVTGSSDDYKIEITKTFDYSEGTMNIEIKNRDGVDLDTDKYTVEIAYYANGKKVSETRTFEILKKEFNFDLDVTSAINNVQAKDSNTWTVTLTDLIPDDLSVSDFAYKITDSSGTDMTSYFTITTDTGTNSIIVKNKAEEWKNNGGFLGIFNSDYTPSGTYTITVYLSDDEKYDDDNNLVYEDDKVPGYSLTYTFTIGETSGTLTENTSTRESTRYIYTDTYEDYDIKITGKSGDNYIIIENDTTSTISYDDLTETYLNIGIDDISFVDNRVVITINDSAYITKYKENVEVITTDDDGNETTTTENQITYVVDGVETTVSDTTFKASYSTAYGRLTGGDYTTDSDGYLQYHKVEENSKLVVVKTEKENTAPLSVSGGEIKFQLEYEHIRYSDLSKLEITLKNSDTGATIGTYKRSSYKASSTYDGIFELQVDTTSGSSSSIIYVTMIYTSQDTKYSGNYKLYYSIKDAEAESSFTLSEGNLDYFVYSNFDAHTMGDDYLGTDDPYSNQKYEYYLSFNMQQSGKSISTIEIDSIDYQIYDHQADYDDDGNLYFFDQVDYIVLIKRIYNDNVYFDVSFDEGDSWDTDQVMTRTEFQTLYYEADEYLDYYTLDSDGYITGDSYAIHPSKVYTANADDEYTTIEYTVGSDSTVITDLMDTDFKETYPDLYIAISTRFLFDEDGNIQLGAISGQYEKTTDDEGNAIVGTDITDKFYIIRSTTDATKNALTIYPKTEVDAGTYYIYVSQGTLKGVGYIYNDSSEDAAISRLEYPEMWLRNIHRTSLTYGEPVYSFTINDTKLSNDGNSSSLAYTNIQSYIDIDLNLNYIYDLTGFSYKVQYNNNGTWEDASSYFTITDDINETLTLGEDTTDVNALIQDSSIKLATINDTTQEGTYRVVLNYTNNGVKAEETVTEFEVNGNFYALNIDEASITDKSFIHNWGSSIKIPIKAYSVTNIDDIEYTITYKAKDATYVYTYDSSTGNFVDSNNNVMFASSMSIEDTDDEDEKLINFNLYNYLLTDSSKEPISDIGDYTFEASYVEEGNEEASTSLDFTVEEDNYGVAVTNEQAYGDENSTYFTEDLTAIYINYSDLDSIEYIMYYYDESTSKYIDVSSSDSTNKMFTISYKWEEKTTTEEQDKYTGTLYVTLDTDKVDMDGYYYLYVKYNNFDTSVNVPYVGENDSLKKLRELFTWNVINFDVYGVIEDSGVLEDLDENGKYDEVSGYYNNIENTYLDISLETFHTNNVNYIITQDCGGDTCNPSTAVNYNNRFEVVNQSKSRLFIKVKDDLADNLKLETGDYQLVLYYSDNDYIIQTFTVKAEFVYIKIGDYSITTTLNTNNYDYNNLFVNKNSVISIPVIVYGPVYEDVTLSITNTSGTVDYANKFIFDRDEFNTSGTLTLNYTAGNLEADEYTVAFTYTNASNEITTANLTLTFNDNYYNYSIESVTYDPDPAVPNYEDGGSIILAIDTDELMGTDATSNEIIQNTFINNLTIKNSAGTDVTSLFTKSAKTSSTVSKFNIYLNYECDTLTPGQYTVNMTYTQGSLKVERSTNFVMSDYERRITITGVTINSNTSDGKIHYNNGGTYLVNYTSNYSIYTSDLYATITDSEGNDVTSKFTITKSSSAVSLKYDGTDTSNQIDKGEYTVTLVYTDPNTGNVDTKTTTIKMYGEYKEVVISDISASTSPIYAEDSNQYYTFTLQTSNLTDDEIANIKFRIYDEYDNLSYSTISTDTHKSEFTIDKISDTQYKINILSYKARVGTYRVVACIEDLDDYLESNKLAFTVDATRNTITLLDTSYVETKERINDENTIYDYIGVNGSFNFTSTYTGDYTYSIKVIKDGITLKEVPVNITDLDGYKNTIFEAAELSDYGDDVEFALCLNSLPYVSLKEDVENYIKITNIDVYLDNEKVSDSVTLSQGDEKTIELDIDPDDATNQNPTITSSDTSVVTIEGDTIKVTGAGTATITITTKEYTKTITITVSERIESDEYTIDYDKNTIYVSSMTTKTLAKDTFMGNLRNVSTDYKITNSSGTDVTTSTTVIGTNYSIISSNIEYKVIVIGDINGDGNLNLVDVAMLYNYYRNKLQITNENTILAAKVRKTSYVNLIDVTKLYNYVRGKINEL